MKPIGVLGLFIAVTMGMANASPCSWQAFHPRSLSETFNVLNSIVVFGSNDVWAAGYWTDNSGNLANQVLHFDGTNWRQVGAPGKAYTIEAMTGFSDTDLWVVGYVNNESPTALHWDGVRWTPYDLGNGNGELSSVIQVGKPFVWAAGTIGHGPLIMHFDGTRWVQDSVYTPRNNSYLLAIAGTAPSNLWAGGTGSPSFGSLVERRDPSEGTWAQVPNTGTYIDAMSARSKNEVWAVGPPNGGGAFVERWNGQRWGLVPYTRTGAYLYGVDATSSTGYAWVAGFYDDSGMRTAFVDRHRAGRWQDTKVLEAGSMVTIVTALASVPNASDEWAIGEYSNENTYNLFNLAERWTCPAGAE